MAYQSEGYLAWKKKQEEKSSGTSTNQGTGGQSGGYQEWKSRQQTAKSSGMGVSEDIAERFRKLSEDSDAFTSRYRSRYSGGTDQYRADASDWLQSVTESRDLLSAETSDLLKYLEANRRTLNTTQYRELTEMLRNNNHMLAEMLKQAQDEADYWSQWDSEEAYNKDRAEWEAYDALRTLDLGAAQKEIDALEQKQSEMAQNRPVASGYLTGGTGYESKPYAAAQSRGEVDTEASDLYAQISQKKQYLNRAKRLQKGEALAGVADPTSGLYDSDFSKLSRYASTEKETPQWWENSVGDTQYEWINNQGGFRDTYEKDMADLTRLSGGFWESQYLQKNYDKLTEQEVGIYNYYYAKYGKEKAQEYLDTIQESLNYRTAEERFAGMEDQTGLELLFGMEAGLDQFKGGMSALFNAEDDYIAQSAVQIASGMVREDLADAGATLPKWLGGGSVGQMAYDAVTTTANMAPSILVSMGLGMLNPVAGELAGTALMGASAAGNAYQEALNQGYDKGQARTYSALIGGSEAGLQYLLGGLGKLGGKLSGQAITKALNGVDNAFQRFARKLGGNVLSEGLEEGIQEILTPMFKNMALHTDEDINWGEVAYSALLGSVTAFGMEGINTASGELGIYNTGRQLKDSEVTAQRLAEIGSTFSADTVAAQLAGRVDKNTGAYTLGRLFNEIGASLSEQNVSDIRQALVQEGISEDVAQGYARVVEKFVDGTPIDERMVSAIEEDTLLARAMKTALIDKNTTWYQRSEGYKDVLKQMAQQKVSQTEQSAPGQENTPAADTVGATADVASESAPAADTAPAKMHSIASIQNGKVTVRMEDGTEVAAEKADLDPETGVIVKTIGEIDGISQGDANFLLGMLKDNPAINPQLAALGAKETYRYGVFGIAEEHIAKHGVFTEYLTEQQRKRIYETGREAGKRQTAEKQAAVAKKPTGKKSLQVGKVHFEGDRSQLTDRQTASLSAMETVAQALGVQIYVFESKVNERGKHIGANGWYDSKDGSIHIDLHAGANGEGTMLFTLAHELTHYIRQWSPAKFKALADFLMEEYGKKGVNVDGLIRDQIAKAKRGGRTISYDTAYEEVVADAMETMLADGAVLEKLEKLKAQDKPLWQKIRDFINEWAAKIRSVYGGLKPDSVEGRYVAEMAEAVEKLQELFVEGLVEASENAQVANGQKNTTPEDGVKYSVRDGKLTAETTEQDRYELLKDAKIALAEVNYKVIENVDLELYNTRKKSAVTPAFKALAKQLGILNVDLENSEITFPFQFSGKNLEKSLHHQLEYGGTYQDYVKAMSCFTDIVMNAVPIEVHPEKKAGTVRVNPDLMQTYVLVSAYKDGKSVIPVQLEVKEFRQRGKSLYMTVVLTKIDLEVVDTGVPDNAGDVPHLFSRSIISLRQIFENVNEKDARFLKYVPDGFLNEQQKAAKEKALQKQREEYEGYGEKKRSDRDTESVSNRSLLANAFEGVAQNEWERQKIQEYRENIGKMNAEEQMLRELKAQIKELSFAKGPRDKAKLSALRDEATMTANRISNYDRMLLRLEASGPLQSVLEREKQKAYQEAADRGKQELKDYREKAIQTQREMLERFRDQQKNRTEGRNRTAMRHKIQGVVDELNRLLLNESKKHHVPDNLKKAVAEALALVNMDTVGAEERAAKYAALIEKETDPDKIDAYRVTMENILRQGEKMGQRLKELRDAYEEIAESTDPDIANAYDPVIAGSLKELSQSIGDTALKDMSIEQLSDVYDMYRMVLTRIRDANKAFLKGRSESIEALATKSIDEVKWYGGTHKSRIAQLDPVKKFFWNNMKPVYAMEWIGSKTLTDLFNGVRAGEDTWAKDVTEARNYYLEKSRKYGYDSWDFHKKHRFESTSGIVFDLTLEQILSLYAYSRREQAIDHLRLGGFVFDSNIETYEEKRKGSKILKYKVNTADAHQLSAEILGDIIGTLTEEQRGFVEEMQDYLSTAMGAKGNEVTMKMYGVKLFKEKFYFPLKSAKQFLFEQNEASGEVKLKNSGFTNKTVVKANNPVILQNFMDVWSGHVNDMSMYHSFVLPLEDFNRVLNYTSPKREGQESVSMKGTIQSAYGPAAVNYLKQMVTDLNGGARSDPAAGIINKMMGLFKKGSVFASMSVVVQQPSSVARAFALVESKYFIGPKIDQKKHNQLWEEVKRYAPVAIIKEMGYFDTNMGHSTQDFIQGKVYSGFKDKMKALVTDSNFRDELLSKAPALADELAWCSIWEAVKRELNANHPGMDVKSEAFLQMAGERFTEVIVKTQVYDSVLARSGNMRSKDTGMRMATAFMGEPTTSINMVADALMKGKRGDVKFARTAIGAVVASQIVNSILVSFVYAGRDDDEDETYVEKYFGTLAGEILDSLNPAGYIPFIKDIQSIVKGYDVERSDMAVISDLWQAWQNLGKDNVSVYRKVEGFVGSVAQIFGLPVKNIMRDVRGFYQTVESIFSGQKSTGAGVWYAVKGAVTGKDVSNQQQLYEAIMRGNQTQIDRVRGRYMDESAINSAIRKGLRENDLRIREAAVARFNGDLQEYTRLAKEIIAEGHFDQDDVVAAINAEINALDKDETTAASDSKASGLYKADDFATAILGNDQAMANEIRSDIVLTAQRNGKTEREAQSSFASSARTSLKELWLEGKLTDEAAVKAMADFCGNTEEEARQKVAEWAFVQENGFNYDEKAQQFKAGKITGEKLKAMLMETGGKSAEEAEADVVSYSRDAYEEGYFSRKQTAEMMIRYGGLTEEEAEDKLRYLDFKMDNPGVYADDSWIDQYYAEVESSGISIDMYVAYRDKSKGQNKNDKMSVIDSLPISDAQKDALYYAEGWAESKIWQAPWH